MSVDAADLLTPRGRLEALVLWPLADAQVVQATIEAYLADAAAQPGVADLDSDDYDAALTTWAYYRAKDEELQRILGRPSSVDDSDEGSQSYLVTQMTMIREERDRWKAEFDAIMEEATGEVPAAASYATLRSYRD